MGDKCRDCKAVLTNANHTMITYLSICDSCYGLRVKFVQEMNAGNISQKQLERVQHTTVRARRIKEVLRRTTRGTGVNDD